MLADQSFYFPVKRKSISNGRLKLKRQHNIVECNSVAYIQLPIVFQWFVIPKAFYFCVTRKMKFAFLHLRKFEFCNFLTKKQKLKSQQKNIKKRKSLLTHIITYKFKFGSKKFIKKSIN